MKRQVWLHPYEWDYIARALALTAHRDVLSEPLIGRMELMRLCKRISEAANPLVATSVGKQP